MKKIALFLFLLLSLGTVAQVRLAPIFTDNMVIEHSTAAPIWGNAPSNTRIKIVASWAAMDTIVAIANSSGRFSATLNTPGVDMKAHTIWANEVKIDNVMLGEVWLASGQSNMQWNVPRGILDGEQHAAAATNPNIRIFEVPTLGSPTPQDRVDAQWSVCSPQTMRTMSAVGYFFARDLNAQLGVPVGIISSAWGGTPAEPWIPATYIEANPKLKGHLAKEPSVWRPIEPGVCYNQMIHPFVPFAMAGVIWYQGESNRENAEHYDELMTTLINSWRKEFNRPLPFYFVQIAPNNYGHNDLKAAIVREQQQATSRRVPATGMVVVMDKVDDVNNIHPKDKTTVGQRLAAFALAEVYGLTPQQNGYKSPTFLSAQFVDGKAIITLQDAQSGLIIKGKKAVGMTVAGADGIFVQADAAIDKNGRIVVSSKEIKEPKAVRYCFDDTTIGNIFSTGLLPVAPFRTDK